MDSAQTQNLPDIANAQFPVKYEAAKTALAACTKIDECKTWADKAAALASYAKQADDESLFKLCVRIKARAIRQCGELLKQIPPGKTGPEVTGQHRPTTRTEAATDAGLSDRQRKTALRVANVPEDQFDEQVESNNPPTVTALAEQGKAPQTFDPFKLQKRGIKPAAFEDVTELIGLLEEMDDFIDKTEAAAPNDWKSPAVEPFACYGTFLDTLTQVEAEYVSSTITSQRKWFEQLQKFIEERGRESTNWKGAIENA